ETTGTAGKSRATPCRITASDASSAAVTGDWSAFIRRTTVAGETAAISAQARATIVVKSSRSCAAWAGRISEPDVKFLVLLCLAVLGGGLGAVYHHAKSARSTIRPIGAACMPSGD